MNGIQSAGMMSVAVSIPLFTAFLQGLLSFFSPCVIPLLPVYLGYLAGGNLSVDEKGQTVLPRIRTLVNTVFFVIGVSFALMLLGMTFSAVGQFLRTWKTAVNLICGALVILFGLLQLGVIGKKNTALQREYRLPVRLDKLRMSPLTALIMGFCFSFSWTPCIGPTLSGILMTATAAATSGRGIFLMIAYITGFILPFLAVGLFAGAVLSFFRKHRGLVKWTAVISGVLLIAMGVLIMTGTMSSFSNLMASAAAEEEQEEAEPEWYFTLTDQNGITHSLKEYQGKAVVLNFWATWCPYCIQEMPDFEALYRELGENRNDVVILGVASRAVEGSEDDGIILRFLEENGISYPVVLDPTGELFEKYGAEALPTTWFISPDGQPLGYIPGAMDRATLTELINQTLGASQE